MYVLTLSYDYPKMNLISKKDNEEGQSIAFSL